MLIYVIFLLLLIILIIFFIINKFLDKYYIIESYRNNKRIKYLKKKKIINTNIDTDTNIDIVINNNNILYQKKNIDLTTIFKYLNFNFYSSNCCIIPSKNGYIINIRYINYKLIDDSEIESLLPIDCLNCLDFIDTQNLSNKFISVNRFIELDKEYNIIKSKFFKLKILFL